MKSKDDRFFCGKSLFLFIFLLHLIPSSDSYSLPTCENLCRLCIRNDERQGGLCRTSLESLTQSCVGNENSACDSPRRQECTTHLAIVERFLFSANGFWCQRSGAQSSALSIIGNDDLFGNCMLLIQSYDFVRLSDELSCQWRAPPTTLANEASGKSPLFLPPKNEEYKPVSPTEFPPRRRTTRTPDRIQRWKNELSSDLASFSRVLPVTSCNAALHDLCLRHISCRELWKIFRQSCVVDAQNQCKMTNRNDCWQSFEGISWTGLGTCACYDNNSDCQFIRLQTNYNKCIYEIKNSGNIPVAETPQNLHNRHFSSPPPPPPPYYSPASFANSEPASLVAPIFPSDRTPFNEIEEELRRRRILEEQKRQQQVLAEAQRKQQQVLSLYEQQIRQREKQLHEQQQKLNEKQREIQMRQEAQIRQPPPIHNFGSQSTVRTDDFYARNNGVKNDHRSHADYRQQQQQWKPTVHKWKENYRPTQPSPISMEQHKHRRPATNGVSSNHNVKNNVRHNEVATFEQHKLRRPAANFDNTSQNDRRRPFWPTSGTITSTLSSPLMTSDMAPPTSPPPVFRARTLKTTTTSITPPLTTTTTTVSLNEFTGRSVGNTTATLNSTKSGGYFIPKFVLKARARLEDHVHKSAIDILNDERNNTSIHDSGSFTSTTTLATISTAEAEDEIESQLPIPPTNSSSKNMTTKSPSTTTTSTTVESPTPTPTTTTDETKITTLSSTTTTTTIEPFASEITVASLEESEPSPTTNSTKVKSKSSRKLAGNAKKPPVADEKRKYKAQLILSKKNPFTQSPANAKSEESTCQTAYRRCEEESETCRWHLSELQIKCPSDNRRCSRDQCAKAVGRFSRYVPRQMVESLMFCQCAFSDGECKHLQQWMYPRCLYSFLRNKPRFSCTQAVKLCQSDALCWRQLKIYNSSCSVTTHFSKTSQSTESSSQAPSKIHRLRVREIATTDAENRAAEEDDEDEEENFAECTANRMDNCRAAVIGVRGSFLEAPCYCEETDVECLEKQTMILPNNPCIEAAMIDYTVKYFTSSERRLKSRVIDKKIEPSPAFMDEFSFGVTEVTVLPSLSSQEMEMDDENSNKEKYEMVGTGNAEATDSNTTDSVGDESEAPDNAIDVLEIDFNDTISSDDNLTSEASSTIATMAQSSSSLSTTDAKSAAALKTASRPPTKSPAVVLEKKARKPHRGMNLPTGAYVTQRPPPAGGCATRNIDGDWIVHYKDSIFRQYDEWSGRCSSWCECSRNEILKCHELGCLVDMHCEALHTTVGFGERLYLEGRGACQCQSGKFICDTSEDYPELDPGLYISLGYSKDELALLKEKVPKTQLERSGLVSPSSSVTKDIATRLQFALERVLPKGTLCRMAVFEHFVQESVIMFQVQYYGVNHFANETKPKWHVGKLEKTCAPYVRELEHNFLLEKADRYQLILSTIKQLRVIDLLDEIPPVIPSAAANSPKQVLQSINILIHSLLILPFFDCFIHFVLAFVVPFLSAIFHRCFLVS